MTNTSKKVQALLFSALMVLSVFGGVVAFSGSAFGTAVGTAELADSGVTYWQGQDIWLENGTTTATGNTLQVRVVDDNKVAGLVTEFQLDVSSATKNVKGDTQSIGTAKISTSGLEGYYVITAGGEGSKVFIANGTGELLSATGTTSDQFVHVSPNTTHIGNAKFEVTIQTFSVELDDDSIDSG